MSETTLIRARLHWGVFIPAVFSLLVSFVPMIGMILAQRMISDIAIKLTSQPIPTIIPVVFSLIFLLPGIFALIVAWLGYTKSEVTLTDKRLVFRTGILSRTSGELPLASIESMAISESPLGRTFGYGTVEVSSMGGMRFPLVYLHSPQAFYTELQKAVTAAKLPKPEFSHKGPPDDSRYMPKM